MLKWHIGNKDYVRSAMYKIFFIFVYFSIIFQPFLYSAETYYLTVCAIFHNEARFMKEWIDYHRVIGVEHFYLYNNESTDNYQEILQPYINKGIVELTDWPHRAPKIQFATKTQASAYQDAIEKTRKKSRWLAMIDLDEFIVPKEGESLPALLNMYFQHNVGIAIYWQMFGTSNIYMLDPDKLMIEQLLLKAPPNEKNHKMFKCIVYPEFVNYVDNPHFAHYYYGEAVNTKGIPTYPYVEKQNYTVELIQLNHYWPRDTYNILNLKWPRHQQYGCTDFDAYLKSLEILNSVEDLEIQKFVSKIKLIQEDDI